MAEKKTKFMEKAFLADLQHIKLQQPLHKTELKTILQGRKSSEAPLSKPPTNEHFVIEKFKLIISRKKTVQQKF